MNAQMYYPFNVRVPYDFGTQLPVEIIDNRSSLKASFVERTNVHHLPDDWNKVCGFYVLFSGLNPDGSYTIYVGKTSSGFYKRLKEHNDSKDWWSTALLIYRNADSGFTTTQSLYLEGRARELFESFPHVKVENIAWTGDKTLPEDDKPFMETVIASMFRMMRIRGFDTKSHAYEAALPINHSHASSIVNEPKFSDAPLDDDESYREIREYVEIHDDYEMQDSFDAKHHIVHQSIPKVSQERTAKNEDAGHDTVGHTPDYSAIESTELYKKLKAWRLVKAKELKVSAFVVFNNKTLQNIVESRPQSPKELKSINGFGNGKKFEMYGHDILYIVINDIA